MAIKSITRQQFNGFKPTRQGMVTAITVEREWFADETETVIGTVLFDRIDGDWSWVALGRDQKGKFRAIDVGIDNSSQDIARTKLWDAMQKAVAMGQAVFPQA